MYNKIIKGNNNLFRFPKSQKHNNLSFKQLFYKYLQHLKKEVYFLKIVDLKFPEIFKFLP
jgi:hypothetical protein